MQKYAELNKDQIENLIQTIETQLLDLRDYFVKLRNKIHESNDYQPPSNFLLEADKRCKDIELNFNYLIENSNTGAGSANIFNVSNAIYTVSGNYKLIAETIDKNNLPNNKKNQSKIFSLIFNQIDKGIESLRNIEKEIIFAENKNYNFYIENIPVTIFGFNVNFDDKNQNSKIESVINYLQDSIKKIKFIGLEKILKDYFTLGKRIIICFDEEGASSQGIFSKMDGNIWIMVNAFLKDKNPIRIFCHEFGHVYYFNNIGNVGKNIWRGEVESTEFTSKDIKSTADVVKYCIRARTQLFPKNKLIYSWQRDKDLCHKFIDQSQIDSLSKRKRKILIESLKYDEFYLDFELKKNPENFEKDQLNEMIDYFCDQLHNQMINESNVHRYALEEDVTDYAMKHPDETFAEAFAIFVTDGPAALQPKTRAAITEMIRAGGVNPKRASINKRISYFLKIINS
jgi:hypothetical protein